jgi:O-antigen/teichoic acid export membrane protein
MPFFVWEVSLLIYGRIDVVLLSFLSTEAVIGWYGAAYRIISIPAFLPSILIMAIFPALSRAASADDTAFTSIARRSLQSILFITIPIALGMISLADKMIEFLRYPEAFSHSAPVIVILALHVPIVGVDMVIGTLLNALDKQRAWAITGLAASVINPVLNVIFIQRTQSLYDNGALGAALVTVLTELFMMGAGLWLLRGAVFNRASVRFAVMCLLCGLIMTGVVWSVRDQFLPVAVGVGMVTYVLASLGLGTISRQDIRIARSYLIDRALLRQSLAS